MQTTIQQPGAQPTTTTVKKPTWRESRAEKAAAKLAKKAARVAAPQAPHEMSFYERAIEWTHRADKVINLVLGYLLAIASVLGFMDVLSNGEVLSTVPFLFYVWLGIMGLGVDFQILLVIGRMPDLLSMDIEGWQKWAIGIFNAAFLIFLVVMSIVISAVFTEHRDMPVTMVVNAAHQVVSSSTPTIGQAMTTLGIDDKLFVYGRAALATLLLVLMAVDRMMERWRMQITAGIQYVASVAQQIVQQVTPIAPTSAPVQASDMDKMLQAIVAMNAQNLQVMQDMNAQTIARSSQVTISLLEETVNRLTATMSLPGTQMFTQIGTPGQGKQNGLDTTTTGEIEAMASHGPSSQGKQTTDESESYKDQIEALLRNEPNLNDREIADRVGCSLRTANKWKNRVKVSA